VAAAHLFFSGTKTGLWIDGQAILPFVTRGHLVPEIVAWGLLSDAAHDVLSTTLTKLAAALPAAADQLGSLLDPSIVNDALAHLAKMRRSAVGYADRIKTQFRSQPRIPPLINRRSPLSVLQCPSPPV
jgi:hypothetical protein